MAAIPFVYDGGNSTNQKTVFTKKLKILSQKLGVSTKILRTHFVTNDNQYGYFGSWQIERRTLEV
jgi:hypothetical protein